ncbi:MAG: flagellar assembly peptidoglycan hydrolase FlgJ [Sulfuricellaceae bacterium]|nr:flagellar assembly peptidoglycan hydrolase FlgJ [Sulfuricellaceae bacterium]
MSSTQDISSSLAIDAKGVDNLRLLAKQDQTQGARSAARQFEALFMNMMLKSMRDAIPVEGLFDDSNTKLYTEMMDSQLSQSLSKSGGIGLADFIIKQMQRQGVIPTDVTTKPALADVSGVPRLNPLLSQVVQTPREIWKAPSLNGVEQPESLVKPTISTSGSSTGTSGFVDRLWTHAVDAAQKLGIPAHFLLGQAALESGWGKREILDANGQSSHNLFGIKAGKNWNGAVVEVATTEYVNGVAQKKIEKFRAYDSYGDAFKDYARLLKDNPRYSGLFEQSLDAAGFAKGLQKAGYATDPAYADKLTRVINSSAMRQALVA